MAQMASRTDYTTEEQRAGFASAVPLGLIALAFTTALIGASFARFLVPTTLMGMGLVISSAILFGGIVQFICGLLQLRRGDAVHGTVFAAYGGFLAVLGLFFLPASGLVGFFGFNSLALNHALGLLFLCWTITLAVLLVGAGRVSILLLTVLGLLALGFLFLTIGEFANANTPLLMIGGWLSIIAALVAWYAALASTLSVAHSPLKVPMGEMA